MRLTIRFARNCHAVFIPCHYIYEHIVATWGIWLHTIVSFQVANEPGGGIHPHSPNDLRYIDNELWFYRKGCVPNSHLRYCGLRSDIEGRRRNSIRRKKRGAHRKCFLSNGSQISIKANIAISECQEMDLNIHINQNMHKIRDRIVEIRANMVLASVQYSTYAPALIAPMWVSSCSNSGGVDGQ